MNLIGFSETSLLDSISIIILFIALMISLLEFIRAPHHEDRVVILDLFSTILLGLFIMLALFTENLSFLDVALVFAMSSFISILAMAEYIEKTKEK